jgi:Na+/H+-dicarboxylate symporter
MSQAAAALPATPAAIPRRPWYKILYVQVLIAIVLGIDKFMSECRALTNLCGNGVACIVVAWWEGELDRGKLNAGLNREVDPSNLQTAVTTG